jgi:FkbM family methyltransferase
MTTVKLPETMRLDFPDCDIWLHVSSDEERNWRTRACAKEPWTVAWIHDRFAAGDVLYDIGANVGAFSLLAAKHRQTRVVAFEPGYANFARLCENIQLNGCAHAVVPVPLPLAERKGLVGFKYRSTSPGQSRHDFQDRAWKDKDARRSSRYMQPMCAITLDAAVTEFDLWRPHHLKIDVDGAELRVLQGAAGLLQCGELRSILIEVDPGQWDAIYGLLDAAGFRVAVRVAREDRRGAPLYAIFERAQRA